MLALRQNEGRLPCRVSGEVNLSSECARIVEKAICSEGLTMCLFLMRESALLEGGMGYIVLLRRYIHVSYGKALEL